MKSSDSRSSKVNSRITQSGKLIPQIFYDLIGRIIPGAILLFLFFYIVEGCHLFISFKTILFDGNFNYFPIFIVGIFLSYFIGIVFGALGYFIYGKEWKRNINNIDFNSLDFCESQTKASYIYDVIQHMAPDAGARLAKLSAEMNMCRVLIIGFIVLVITNFVKNGVSCLSSWITFALLIFFIISAWLFHRHLKIRSRQLMRNYWHILGKPIASSQSNDGS